MDAKDTVAIVGVGLIGGSIGMAIRQRQLARHVVGIGRRVSQLKKARACRAVTATTTQLAEGIAQAELIVICTPVAQVVDQVRQAAAHCRPGALITDAGSTKASIVAEINGDLGNAAAFVGSHPMAGSEKSGVEHADPDLFEGRLVIVTPGRRTAARHVAAIEQFWQALGARVIRMNPRAHDEAIASVSHLPHLLATVLAASTPEKLLPLVAGGWLDTTRVAAGDPELWRQILTDNRAHVLKALDKFGKVLSNFRTALEQGDDAALLRLLQAGKDRRDTVGN